MRLADLAGRTVAVWGTGKEGLAAVRAIAPVRPAELVVVQDRQTFSAHSWTPELAALAPLHTGPDGFSALARADVVVRSPGIAQTHPWLRELRHRPGGVTVTGGTALWMADHRQQTIGVTGSKGKSTTTTLIGHLLAEAGVRCEVGGNIGVPVLDLPAADTYVLELSVYQCADLTDSPRIVALTSLYPEHLDWSGGEPEYYRDKLNIVDHGPQRVVVNGADPGLAVQLAGRELRPLRTGTPDTVHVARRGAGPGTGPADEPWFQLADEPLFPRSAFALPGRHNEANLCVALGALLVFGTDLGPWLRDAVARFQPLPHRLTSIQDPSGITFVDDSISTIPQSAIHAIEAYADRALTVILGGEDRGVDYQPLRDYLERQSVTATVIGVPDSGPRILAVLADVPTVTTLLADDLLEAVRLARERTPPDGVVLLSPAAPSYGRFDNYEHRSRVFRQAIVDTR